ncbi:MAG TPA: hypothetical protein VKX17_14940 [Planctomycetota bacterium]|nr:hypothetical protein [Planctomycetota bacterium]
MADGVEKPRFDVYAMLLLLSFLMTLGAVLLLNDDLSSNYGFKLFGDKPAGHTWHITEYQEVGKHYAIPGYVELRKQDLDDWETIHKGEKFPIPKADYEWPKDYDVAGHPINPALDNQQNVDDASKPAVIKGLEALAAVKPDEPKKDEPKKDEKPPEKAPDKVPEKAPEK